MVSRGRRVRLWHREHFLDDRVELGGDLLLERFELGVGESGLQQVGAKTGEWVALLAPFLVLGCPVVLDVAVVVGHQADCLRLDQRWPGSAPRSRRCVADGHADGLRVVAVHGHARHSVGGGAIGEIGQLRGLRDRRHLRPIVVLDDEDDRQLAYSREVQPLVGRSLVHRAVADRDDAHPSWSPRASPPERRLSRSERRRRRSSSRR